MMKGLLGTAGRWLVFATLVVFVSLSWRWESPYLVRLPLLIAGWIATILLVWYLGTRSRWQRFLETFEAWWQRRRCGSVVTMALAVFAAAAFFCVFLLEAIPHIYDSFTYWFQARIFASGASSLPAPPLPEFYRQEWMIVYGGKWFGVFPPGWPALLALGLLARVPYLVNPLLGALALFAIYGLAKELYGKSKARAACLLIMLSPFFVFMNSEFMAHTSFLFFSSLFAWLFVKGCRQNKIHLWLGAGVAMGVGILIRPIPAVCITLAFVLFFLWRERRKSLLLALCFVGIGMAAAAGVYLIYNHHLVGQWLVSPLSLTSPQNRMGFGRDIGLNWYTFDTPGHNPWRGLLNLNFNMAVLDNDLFGWPIPSLLFIFALLAFGRKRRSDELSFVVIGAVVIGYFLYWYHGVVYGARFYFCLIPYFAMATVEGIWQFPEFLTRRVLLRMSHRMARILTQTLVAVCLAFSVFCYFPKAGLLIYPNYLGVNRELYHFAANVGAHHAIVFVTTEDPLQYEPGLIANALRPAEGDIIFARDLGPEQNQRLSAKYPDRTVFYYRYTRPENRLKEFVKKIIGRGKKASA